MYTNRTKVMKRIYTYITLLALCITCSGCSFTSENSNSVITEKLESAVKDDKNVEKAEDQIDQQIELNVTKQVPQAVDENNNITNSVDFTVCSVAVEKEKITSLEQSDRFRINDIYNILQEDGSIGSDHVFVTLEITMKSVVDVEELYLTSCRLYYAPNNSSDYMVSELSYQSDPIAPNDPHKTGVTSLNAGEEKKMTIGFLLNEEIMQSDSVSLYAAFTDFDEKSGIENPMFKIANKLEALS